MQTDRELTPSQQFALDHPRITRGQAWRLLGQHGLTPMTPTACCDGKGDRDSTFDATFGEEDYYDTQAVLDWLGY